MIIHKKGSLFDAPKSSVLVHACNAKGVWGRGIAVEFKNRFPSAFKEYHTFCKGYVDDYSLVTREENGHRVGCLVTSHGFKESIDIKEVILANTRAALHDLMAQVERGTAIHSNKFNSGLFGVPWELTEKVLAEVLSEYNVDWTVWEF